MCSNSGFSTRNECGRDMAPLLAAITSYVPRGKSPSKHVTPMLNPSSHSGAWLGGAGRVVLRARSSEHTLDFPGAPPSRRPNPSEPLLLLHHLLAKPLFQRSLPQPSAFEPIDVLACAAGNHHQLRLGAAHWRKH